MLKWTVLRLIYTRILLISEQRVEVWLWRGWYSVLVEQDSHHSGSSQQGHVWPSLRSPGLAQTLVLRAKKKKGRRKEGALSCAPRAYIETPDPLYDFFNKVRGALPVVGLLSRILSDDGGVGADRIQFKEFCSRVYRSFPPDVPPAFFELEDRHGSTAKPQYVLLWCWAAALGAGLLRSEDMMLGATRLRVSFDIQYEEENFNLLMDEATKKRKLSKSPVPFVPYEARAEKALDGICKCCIGESSIEEEDARLLTTILQGVFPAADKGAIEKLVRDKVALAEDTSFQGSEKVTKESDENMEQASILESDTVVEFEEMLEEQQGVLEATQPEEKSSSLV